MGLTSRFSKHLLSLGQLSEHAKEEVDSGPRVGEEIGPGGPGTARQGLGEDWEGKQAV